MSHTLTYHSIQNGQLCHHHVVRGISPYAPAPAREDAHAHAYAPTPTHGHANAKQMHPQRTRGIVWWALPVSSAK
ncbi:hypothetical protein O181_073286 [Austropuccinia psidii MF-1]|uniref:Uncharacterized protein n=1 Tax=Austropuccinia psidii MF-1 TaxID=1389203 RepID=A0A9Q3FAT7_9BASI|nr:hypothetical protein [Austropuccinia psidii MF-1]